MPTSTDHAGSARRPTASAGEFQTGLAFAAAQTLAEVVDAWTLVYRSYLQAGLIRSNPWRLHTVPQAIQPRAAVICGRIGELMVSTISGYVDQPDGAGLPLDAVYPDQLAELRREGRQLLEIGLFADRREHIERSIEALLELMRRVTYFGVTLGCTDGVVGVHPRHAPFYERLLGFERIGEEKTYSLVKDNPVVLLRLDWDGKISLPKPPRGLRYFRDNPISLEAFAQRFVLSKQAVAGTDLEQYLESATSGKIAVG